MHRMPPLIVPDGKGPWAVRYLWIQHTKQNDEFVSNYFNWGNNAKGTGLALRKQPAQDPHNEIFETSRDNGNLVWRVKTHNPFANSIDYVEVWRSAEVLDKLFNFNNRKKEVVVNNTIKRTVEARNELREGLSSAGFCVHRYFDVNSNWPLISPMLAVRLFRHFQKKFIGQENCIVNTAFNEELNAVENFNPISKF